MGRQTYEATALWHESCDKGSLVLSANMNPSCNEQALVRLYTDLTGASEPAARNVFMYVCCRECNGEGSDRNGPGAVDQAEVLGRQPALPALSKTAKRICRTPARAAMLRGCNLFLLALSML